MASKLGVFNKLLVRPCAKGKYFNRYSHSLSTEVEINKNVINKTLGNHEEIPFLFPPHIVSKAYIVQEGLSSSLTWKFNKMLWLTKTIASPGLPTAHQPVNQYKEINYKMFHDSIFQSVAFQKRASKREMIRNVPERIKYSIFTNMLNQSLIAHNNKPHIHPDNCLLCHESILETHWFRDYKFYQTSFRPTFTIKTRRGFDVVEEPRELHPNEVKSQPGPYGPYEIGAYRHPVVHLRNRPCLDNNRFMPLKQCHTSITLKNGLKDEEEILTTGVMTLFTQLSAQAQTTGTLHGTRLKTPLVAQGIISNGYQVIFMVYQLNTLCMLDDKGVWNRFWYSRSMDLFERTSEGQKLIYEETPCGEKLLGHNKQTCDHFLSFIGKATTNEL